MFELLEKLLPKLKFVAAGMLVIANLFLLTLLLPAVDGNNTATASSPSASSAYNGPNAVTNGMGTMMDEVGKNMDSTERNLQKSLRAAGATAERSGEIVTSTGKFLLHGVASSISFVGRGIATVAVFSVRTVASGIAFIFYIPSNVFGFIANMPVVSSVVKPSTAAQVQSIDPHSPTLFASHVTEVPTVQTAAQVTPSTPSDTTPMWPIHGEITTLFGVPHWPYQPTHSGIDISDNQRSGVTPIKPFKPGRVVETIHSGVGLGNHVAVDHGNGIVSVYAHLASIYVSVGQEVNKTTILGLEGSTGASTGPHLHFEIRVNGQPVDPLPYLGNRP